MADLRQAWRSLRRDPTHSLVVVSILALGIGATVAVYSVVAGVLLRPLPFPDPDRLVRVRQIDPEEGFTFYGASGPSFSDWARQTTTLSALAAYTGPGSPIVGEGEGAVRVRGTEVTGQFFQVLRVRPALGRLLVPSDGEAGAPPVAVLAHGLWRQHYGGDPAVVGRTVVVEGVPHQVVGVAAAGFGYPEETELWTPVAPEADYMHVRGAHILGVVARLADGVTPEAATAELDRILEAVPGYGFRTRVAALKEEMVGSVRTPMLVLLGAVAFVLLIAAANVANLMLARAEGRRRELAIRGALGAGWGRLASQVMAESVLLATAAGVAGVVLAAWLVEALVALVPGDLPRSSEVGLDAGVLGMASLLVLGTGLLTGLVPAVRALRSAPGTELRERDRRGGSRSGRRVAASLVVAEVALSVVLLFGAGLLIRSFLSILAVDPGFRTEQVTTFGFALPPYRYGEEWQVRQFHRDLLERVRALPVTESAALARNLPMTRTTMITPALLEGREVEDPPYVQIAPVSEDYFRTLDMPVLAGRAFTRADDEEAPPVAIVDEAFARAYFDGQDPVGRKARTYFGEPVMREIVGMVASTTHGSLTEAPPPKFYYPLAQMPAPGGRLVVRSAAPTTAVIAAVRAAAEEVGPGVPFTDVATIEQLVARETAAPRFYASMLGVFAALALLLALTGFFAVLSRTVTTRRREIGVRLAVGARPAEVVRLVVRQGMVMTGVGLLLGVVGALAAARLLGSLLFRVGTADPAVLAGVVLTLALVALAAAALPARRAAATDPVTVLKAE